MKKGFVIVILVLFIAAHALAVDLVNKDGKKYEVKIHSGASTTNSSIEGGTTKLSICSDCKIEVVGVGEVDAEGSDKVIIKDGSLTKE